MGGGRGKGEGGRGKKAFPIYEHRKSGKAKGGGGGRQGTKLPGIVVMQMITSRCWPAEKGNKSPHRNEKGGQTCGELLPLGIKTHRNVDCIKGS